MEPTVKETQFLIIAVGETEPIKEELQSVGFRWNPLQQRWCYQGHFSGPACEVLEGLMDDNPGRDIYFHMFVLIDNAWIEIPG